MDVDKVTVDKMMPNTDDGKTNEVTSGTQVDGMSSESPQSLVNGELDNQTNTASAESTQCEPVVKIPEVSVEVKPMMDCGGKVTEPSEDPKDATVGESEVSTLPVESDSSKVDAHEEESGSNIEKLPKESVDECAIQSMDTSDSTLKSNEKNKDGPCDSKDGYRDTIQLSDSDSDNEDSDSSSVSSLSSPSGSECGSVGENECTILSKNNKRKTYPVIKAKGELLPEDLPPIEELHISVPSTLCAEIGAVTSIVNTLVVIQSLKGVPALDLDSVLFLDNGSRALGLVFDVFGPVTEPLYCVRFNSAEQIAEHKINPGDKVYYAPQTQHSKYVFLQELLRIRGSDASRKDDIESRVQVEYSDDEEERKALKKYGGVIPDDDEGLDPDQLKRKRDPNEVFGNKKKIATFSSPRCDRNSSGRGAFTQRNRLPNRQTPQNRPNEQRQYSRPITPHQGPIHPPSFNFPPPPIPGPSTPQNSPAPANSYLMPQGMFNNQFYQNSMAQNPGFGQLPYGQPQMDPRIAQFGAQFAQMVCNLQNTTPAGSVNSSTPTAQGASPFTVPFNQPFYSAGQNGCSSFFKPPQGPPPQAAPAPYAGPHYSAPPPPLQSNLTSTNVPPTHFPPPGQPPYPPQPNTSPATNTNYTGHYPSSYSSYPNLR